MALSLPEPFPAGFSLPPFPLLPSPPSPHPPPAALLGNQSFLFFKKDLHRQSQTHTLSRAGRAGQGLVTKKQ